MSLKSMTWVFILLLINFQSLGNRAGAQTPGAAFEPGQLIVGYISKNDRDQALQELTSNKDAVRVRGENAGNVEYQAIGDTSVRLRIELPMKMRGRADKEPGLELEILQEAGTQLKAGDKRIKYAHPNWIIGIDPVPAQEPVDMRSLDNVVLPQSAQEPTVPNDFAYVNGLHWDYKAPPIGMNAIGAWKVETGSKDIVVAVVDSGILPDHPDIQGAGNILPGYNFVSPGRSPDPTEPKDACPQDIRHTPWHGSHVAGTIGVVGSNNGRGITGINWSVSVLPVRVLGLCGRGNILDIADGIRWAAGLQVTGLPPDQFNKHPANIINLSLTAGGPCNSENIGVLTDALDAARAAGSVIVVAAGNSASDIANYYPAGCKQVISVAASNREGHLASYSNYGDVAIMAPGGEPQQADELTTPRGVWSVVQASDNNREGIQPLPGTSMAAPHVSGAIALALAKHPDWRGKPDLIAQKVREAAVPTINGACPHPCGPGQLDAAKLVEIH